MFINLYRTITTCHTVNRIIHTSQTLCLLLLKDVMMVRRVEIYKKLFYNWFKRMKLGDLPDNERDEHGYMALPFAPKGCTIYMTTCGLPVFMDREWNELDPVFDIPEVELAVVVCEYSSVTESQYYFVLVAVLNNKIRLCLFKLTPPFPKDKSVKIYRTLTNAEADISQSIREGFLLSIYSRPPPHPFFISC